MEDKQRINNFKLGSQIALFGVSFAPLFLIIIVRTLFQKGMYLHWGGFNKEALLIFVQNFGFVVVCGVFLILAIIGTIWTLKDCETRKGNGFSKPIKSIHSKSAETINYLATYIIPFVYDANNTTNIIIMGILLLVICCIYINSSLLIVNPILAIKYGVYDITYMDGEQERSAIIMCSNKYLIEGDELHMYPIGQNMFYCFKK